MRSVVFTPYGEPADVLTVTETPMTDPGAGEVRVRLTARPINPSDLLLIRGHYGRPAGLRPPTPGEPATALVGFEGAGVVDKAAAGVGLRPGDRVAVSADGTWQEYLNVPAADVVEIPDSLPDDLACQLTINPMTANLLLDGLGLVAGDVLLQTASASAVGRMITTLARQRGIRCAGLVRRPHPAPPDNDSAQIVADPSDSAREQLAEFAGAPGIAAAIDAVGGATGRLALDCLREGGRMTVYGMLSGSPIPVLPDALVFRGITLDGFWLPERLKGMLPEQIADLTRTVTEQLTSRQLNAPVAARYDLADIKEAVRRAESGPGGGKILLVG
ncbi:zinc-dependent alcohol dehydrogenase family protein [Streptomyces sp. NPDC006704]|uniref:zinc-dependent alcohol dehydrogenase family protein n=1 Tax=Streptomyces sp. NPDC006704 TaxID=3364760 RepID=UPI0036A89A91